MGHAKGRPAVGGVSDKTGSSFIETPVHPIELVAMIYHLVGIDPGMMMMNHLNQPRELVQADVAQGLLA